MPYRQFHIVDNNKICMLFVLQCAKHNNCRLFTNTLKREQRTRKIFSGAWETPAL